MPTLRTLASFRSTNRMHPDCPTESPQADRLLEQAIKQVHALVPPLWPLADYVAVNPFFGLSDQPFLQAAEALGKVRDCTLLMPRSYFKQLVSAGRLADADVKAAFSQCLHEHPAWYESMRLDDLGAWLTQTGSDSKTDRVRTVADSVDEHLGSSWSSHIINDITRHCAAHFDQGQAGWPSPWQADSLYSAWREAARLSWRMDLLGLKGFRDLVDRLPEDPQQAVSELLTRMDIHPSRWGQFLLAEIFSIAGWASYIRYQVRDDENSGRQNNDLTGLLAIRLAYDSALLKMPGNPCPFALVPEKCPKEFGTEPSPAPDKDLLARHVFQVAAERAYRESLLESLTARKQPAETTTDKKLQMVFCIDVRSEVFRRHLESLDDSIETFGFAGFFGIPFEYLPPGSATGQAQCPVLLKPGIHMRQRPVGASPAESMRWTEDRLLTQKKQTVWKLFQTSATSTFSFVESLGLGFIAKLAVDSFGISRGAHHARPGRGTDQQGCAPGPDIHAPENRGLDANARLDLAENLLRNLGLTSGFAPLVVFCGHASEVTNNPYKAALDCGACGGHSGEPNARVAASLLNDRQVRQGLEQRGIVIPDTTWFIAAVHNTTTDEITLCDTHLVPPSHTGLESQIMDWLAKAGQLARQERCPRLGATQESEILHRARDWGEVRPEWGLAGNATLIVAPRSRTKGLNLGGRAFLHSYDHRLDPELKVLELIMTAPMVVANWINMQYYASAVDPVAFGSGDKLIHNVVGRFGVLQGNGGDLMTGLPLQCLQDGNGLQHEPLRLLVVIEAPRASVESIIHKHQTVQNLARNGWLALVVLDQDRYYRWIAQEHWAEESQFRGN